VATNPPEEAGPRAPRLRLLCGALAAAGLGALALAWQGGTAWAGLPGQAGPTHAVVLAGFLLALGLLAGPLAPRLAERPLLPLLVGFLPLGLGALLAGLTAGNLPGVADLKGHCDLLLAVGFEAELLWALGLLGTAALWLGCLPALLPLLPAAPEGPLRGRAVQGGALALWAGAVAVAFVDGLMPERAAVGGAAVRGLWPLALGLPALVLAAHALRRAGGPRPAGAALAVAWTALGGLLCLALAAWLGAHAWGLEVMAFELEGLGATPVWPGDALEASLVAATALRGLGPALALALAVAAGVAGWRSTRAGRRQALGLLGGSAAAALLALALLTEQAGAFEERCLGLSAPGLELGLADPGLPWAEDEARVLWLFPQGMAFDDQPLDPRAPRLPAPDAPGERLLVALDRAAPAGRLLDALELAGRSGWGRFGLLLRPPPPDPGRCALEQRAFGLCLSARVDALRALPLAGPGEAPTPGPGRLLANVLLGAEETELTFGGFGPGSAPAELAPLADRIPRSGPDGGRARLAEALGRARAAFPDSRAAWVVVEDRALPLAELLLLLEAVRGGGARFPELGLSASTR
jgi:hypothetical protein